MTSSVLHTKRSHLWIESLQSKPAYLYEVVKAVVSFYATYIKNMWSIVHLWTTATKMLPLKIRIFKSACVCC